MTTKAKIASKPKKPFRRLTAAQKRVAIAKDVLKQIKTKRYKIATGNWAKFKTRQTIDQEWLKKHPQSCRVCGIGAAIVSAIRLFNVQSFTYGQVGSVVEALNIIKKYFTFKQSVLIENAFERGNGGFRPLSLPQVLNIDRTSAIHFGNQNGTPKSRAIAIFKNIIKNKGTFKP